MSFLFTQQSNTMECGRDLPMTVTQTLPEVRFWMITRLMFLHQQTMKRPCAFDCEWETLRMNEPDSAGPLSHSLSSLVCSFQFQIQLRFSLCSRVPFSTAQAASWQKCLERPSMQLPVVLRRRETLVKVSEREEEMESLQLGRILELSHQ